MGRRLELQVARTDEREIQTIHRFLQDLGNILNYGMVVTGDGEERRVDSVETWLRENWRPAELVFSRVLANCSVLYEHCCDHSKEVLDWPQEIHDMRADLETAIKLLDDALYEPMHGKEEQAWEETRARLLEAYPEHLDDPETQASGA